MSFNDDNKDPMAGKGEEMLPKRGIPFEDEIEEALPEGAALFNAGEISDAEMDDLFTEGVPNEPRDSGMGAGETFEFPPDELDAFAEDEIFLPDEEIEAIGFAGGFELAAAAAPGLATWEVRAGSAHLDSANDLLKEYVTRERLTLLWNRIDQAQMDVKTTIPNLDVANKLLDQIERARNEFLADMMNYEEVERTIGEVELRVAAARRSLEDNGHAVRMFLYEFLWGIAITLGLLGVKLFYSDIENEIGMIIFSAGMGGLGGIVSAMYALWRHTAEEINYSKQYALWYISNPILGTFLGIVAYLIMLAGVVSLTGELNQDNINFPYTVYLLAFILGFQQNVAWELIRRFRNVFLPDSEEYEAL
jgi:hypothetical protein